MRKCEGVGEVAVMEVAEVGVRMTRARTAIAEEMSAGKKRKFDGELELSASSVQLQAYLAMQTTSGNSSTCPSVGSDHVLASCCSSNASSEVAKDSLKFADLEEENEIHVEVDSWTFDLVDCTESRLMTPSTEFEADTGDLDSTARPPNANACGRSTAQKMPSEAELEEFFAAAEKDIQKQFTDKYNFDIVEDKPLEGRYEWVELKP